MDRRAGNYRVAGNVLWSLAWRGRHRSVGGVSPPATPSSSGSDLTLVGSADRSFARETRTLRAFAAYDPVDRTFFGRIIAAVSLRTTCGSKDRRDCSRGSASDTLGRLTRRDFLYARLKVFF